MKTTAPEPIDLAEAYAAAWAEWLEGDDAAVWDLALADGLRDEPEWVVGPPAG